MGTMELKYKELEKLENKGKKKEEDIQKIK